jgi:hypothetical protein
MRVLRATHTAINDFIVSLRGKQQEIRERRSEKEGPIREVYGLPLVAHGQNTFWVTVIPGPFSLSFCRCRAVIPQARTTVSSCTPDKDRA